MQNAQKGAGRLRGGTSRETKMYLPDSIKENSICQVISYSRRKMPIDEFIRPDFEAFIVSLGYIFVSKFEYSEYTYYLQIDPQAQIKIRSSVGKNNVAGSAGENSIRLLLVDDNDRLLAKLDGLWVTRVSGWRQRLTEKIEILKSYRLQSGDCETCHSALSIFTSHSAKNPDRLFVKCTRCDEWKFWLGRGEPWFNAPAVSKPVHELEVSEKKDIEDILAEVKGFSDKDNFSTPAETLDILDNLDSDSKESNPVGFDLSVIDELSESESALGFDLSVLEELDAPPNTAITATEIPTPNSEQQEMIQAPILGAYRVIAGPGSGKTMTLGLRYKYLVERGINPEQIVAVTFGGKAAEELLSRIRRFCPEIEGGAAERSITTIHAFSLRQLKAAGYIKNNVEVIDGRTMWKMKVIYENALQEVFPDSEDRPGWKETADWVYTCKAHSRRPDREMYDYLVPVMNEFYAEGLTKVRMIVDQRFQADNLITFSDMVYLMDVLLQDNPIFLQYIQSKFSHVILDEGQDTSFQAMRILSSISPNFTIVGDPDQLLYRFAGAAAEYNLFDGFEERFPAGKLILMERNHRSAKVIVKASTMIRNNYETWGGPYPSRFQKVPIAVRESIGELETGMFASPLEEAEFVAQTIARMIAVSSETIDEISGKFFIGMRTRAYSVYFEDQLSRLNIPYVNTTGISFWCQSHVQLVLNFLRVGLDSFNSEAFGKIYNIPSKYWTFPWKSSPRYGEYIDSRMLSKEFYVKFPNLDSLTRRRYSAEPKFRPGIQDIEDFFNEMYPEMDSGADLAILYILNYCLRPYLEYQEGHTEADGEGGKLDDFAAMREISSQFGTVQEFLNYADNLVAAAQAAKDKDWNGRVVISTIHKLKGLERPYVFAVGVSEYDDTVEQTGFTSILPHTFCFVSPPDQGKLPGSGLNRIEDERCLFFVLITRAKEKVWVTSPMSYRKIRLQPSRFLVETFSAMEDR